MEHSEKLTLQQLKQNKGWERAVIVFTEDSFGEWYSLESRSYEVNSDCKYFNPDMIGNSLFGDCLDGKDTRVRLDRYIHHEEDAKKWKVEYCYIIE